MPAGRFKPGDMVWVMWPFKHPALHGMIRRRRKARIVKETSEYVPGTAIFEPRYEIKFVDDGYESGLVGEKRLRLVSPLEQLAEAADGDDYIPYRFQDDGQ